MIDFYPKSEFEVREVNGLIEMDVMFTFTMTPYFAEKIADDLVRYCTNQISVTSAYKDPSVFRLLGWWMSITSNDKEASMMMAKLLLNSVGKCRQD